MIWYHVSDAPLTGELQPLYLSDEPLDHLGSVVTEFEISPDAVWGDIGRINEQQKQHWMPAIFSSMDSIGYNDAEIQKLRQHGFDVVWDKSDFYAGYPQVFVVNPEVLTRSNPIIYKGHKYKQVTEVDKHNQVWQDNSKEAEKHVDNPSRRSTALRRARRRGKLLSGRRSASTRVGHRYRGRVIGRHPYRDRTRTVGELGLRNRLTYPPRRGSPAFRTVASDFADKYGFNEWVDLSTQEIAQDPELLQDLFDLIQTAYGEEGHKKYLQPVDLLRGDLTVHAINIDADPEPDALVTWKDKPAGNKFDSTGHDGGRAAINTMLDEFHRLLGQPGFFVEVSGAPAAIVLKRWKDVVVIEDPDLVQAALPGKTIQWVGEHPSLPGAGWYERDIGGKPVTKIMVGLPRV